MQKRWIVMWIALAVIVIVTVAPIVSVIIAGSIANANGCALNEGSVNPCIVGGKDIGETLYTLGVMGWLMLATIPLGGIALLTWLIVAVVMRNADRRKVTPPTGQV